jgi:hypothetical protein
MGNVASQWQRAGFRARDRPDSESWPTGRVYSPVFVTKLLLLPPRVNDLRAYTVVAMRASAPRELPPIGSKMDIFSTPDNDCMFAI